jgi:23S rRNA G2069 N7-methylase RlmK/C1962 C5-methylase RlmI
VREAEFMAILAEAAQRARRSVVVAGVHGAAPDHPVRRGFPEGHYLKLALLRIGEAAR